ARIIKDHDQSISEYISKNDIKNIKKIITEFVKVDPDSFSFRYPKDKEGNQTLAGIQYINLRKLRDQMNILKVCLDKYYLVVSVLRDYQIDMRADYEP